MALVHPSPDQLNDYLINHLSEVETVNIEQHVFACDACFRMLASRDLYDLAVTKACVMLSSLETDGIKMLTATTLEQDSAVVAPQPIVHRPVARRWEPRYAAAAATVVAGALTFSSIGSVRDETRVLAVSLVNVPSAVQVAAVSSTPEVVPVPAPEAPPAITPRKRRAIAPEPVMIKTARHTRPFLPPNGDVEAPELLLTDAPAPHVVAQRVHHIGVVSRLPEAPAKHVKKSRRVFRALASPFKKLGGALANLAVGDDVAEKRTSAD
jgi:hypothetical protein